MCFESFQRLDSNGKKEFRVSPTADALHEICDLDLSELTSVEPPRGFGRD
jgi:hypothetical protein